MASDYETMIKFRERQDPLSQDEFDKILKEHMKFIKSGGAGVNLKTRLLWKSWVVKKVVFGQYLGPEGTDGKQIALSYNNLENIKFDNISLTYADLVGVRCRKNSFKKTNLTGSILIDSNFTGSSFEGANLSKTDFSRSIMVDCSLRNVNLTDADFENVDLTGADLTGAIITPETNFKGTIFKDAVKDFKKVQTTKKNIKTKKTKHTLVKSYMNCSICKTLPDNYGAYWKGGDLQSKPMPASAAKLEVVGAPIYNKSTSYSHTVIQRCPECGTCYRWQFEYEYLVGGSEDEIDVTRLSRDEGEKEVRKIILDVRMQYAQLRAEGVAKLQLLKDVKKLDNEQLHDAVNIFHHNQLVKSFDISYAIKHLVEALINHRHIKDDCNGQYIYWTLSEFKSKNEKNGEKLLNLILSHKGKIFPPEVQDLVKECKLEQLEKLTKKVKILEEKLRSENLEMEDYKRINRRIEQLYKKIKDFS